MPVVLDLMIHDIDLALHALEEKLSALRRTALPWSATAWTLRYPSSFLPVPWPTSRPARSASPRCGRFVCSNRTYLSVDLLNRSAQVVRLETVDADAQPVRPLSRRAGTSRDNYIDTTDIGEANAIADELSNFHAACSGVAEPQVPLRDGLAALRVAEQVMDCISSPTS